MVLSGVVPEILYFNFLGAWFTHSIWFPLGVTTVLWFMNTVIAIHRNDPFKEAADAEVVSAAFQSVLAGASVDEAVAGAAKALAVADSAADLIITLNFRTPATALLGVLLGLTVAWTFQLAPLLDPEPWSVRARTSDESGDPVWVFNFSFVRFVLGGLAAAVGGNFVLGNFQPEVSQAWSLALGSALLVFGLLLIVYTLLRWFKSDQPSDWLNFGYALALAVLMVLPAIYDYLLGIRPYQGLLFQLALLLTSIVIALLTLRFFRNLSPQATTTLAQTDIRYTPTSGRIWTRWLSLWAPLAIVYAVGWLRDETTLTVVDGKDKRIGDVVQVLLAVSLTAVVLELIFLTWGYLRWRQPRYADRWVNDEDQLAAYPLLNNNNNNDAERGNSVQTGAHTNTVSTRSWRMDAYKFK